MAGLSGLDAEKMKLVQDLELEMMTDMYARLTNACHKKCIAPKYREADLQKVSRLFFFRLRSGMVMCWCMFMLLLFKLSKFLLSGT